MVSKKINWTKKKKLLTVVSGIVVLTLTGVLIAVNMGEKQEYVYKETTVQYGSLVAGVTESGTVDIGTIEQTFDLDMSALQRVETSSSDSSSTGAGGFGGNASGMGMSGSMGQGGSSAGGGMDMFSQIFGMGGGNTSSTGSDSSLTIAEVCVSVGQQINAGDVLFVLEEDSVTELKEQLQTNVEKAEADLEAVYADQKLSRQTAEYTYESSTAYGSYAETEYNTTIRELEDAVTAKQKAWEQAQESLSDYQERLATATADYEQAAQVLENCQWSLDNTDPEDVYSYVYFYDLTKSAKSTADSLEQKKEQLEKNVEQAQENVETALKAYNSAKRSLEQGKLTAKETLSLRQLAYDTAQETYDIAMAYLEQDAADQEEIYQEAQEKWEEFSSHIDGNNVCAGYDGVVTSVELAAGDSIRTGDTLITLYNKDEVTMTVTVDEEDMTDISLGSPANILFTAYPDAAFKAEVTEIADAVTDSSGYVTYDVTVTLQGDVSGLFQGMTGDVTFVTEETTDTLYVARRAVITEGDATYVKVKKEDGSIEKKEVTTGITDGVNIEIVEGLSEGDVVLIESAVSQ